MATAMLAATQAGGLATPGQANAQAPAAVTAPATIAVTPQTITQLSTAQLESLYRGAGPGNVPVGRVRGIPIVAPGSNMGPAASRAGRLVWQGKVFDEDGAAAVNRFFGVRAIRGRVYQGASWLDGQASLILDYQGTSLVYGRYRDEIREIAPGFYLGVMYARTQPTPTIARYFAFTTD